MRHTTIIGLCLLWVALAGAQVSDPLHWSVAQRGAHTESFEMSYVSPAIHKWYEPRYQPETYMSPWYARGSNFARDSYRRYISLILEGDESFDNFGKSLGRGWLVYNWSQEQVGSRGSFIDKRGGGLSSMDLRANQRPAYRDFFNRLVIASDQRGGASYRLMIGDEIFTRFTPLTFNKPRFNGVRLDYAAEQYQASLLLSRPSNPDAEAQTNSTTVMGSHLEFQAGPGASFGLTYVNAHNVLTQVEFGEGNPLRGILTSLENQPLDKLWVRIRDDSPGRGGVGAALAGFDIVMTDTSDRQLRGRDIDFLPLREGGVLQGGRLFARDEESILLEFDLGSLDFEDVQTEDLQSVQVELSLANDYRVEIATDLQTDGQRRNAEVVFLPVARAAGNVQDNSNTQVLRLDYGLPTASELYGVDWNLSDWKGLSLMGELVLNRRYSRYPNPNIPEHHEIAENAHAGYLNGSYRFGPWMFFGEGFSIEHDYSTRYWLTDRTGRIKFKSQISQVYEFVDDDDDLIGLTEWERPFFVRWGGITESATVSSASILSSQREVAWPGLDENGDFINDNNQNQNIFPDYEEPFLRYRSDRPEFLFGLDMNHNDIIDRFENDLEPDYPYKRDHRGYNAYLKVEVLPDLELSVGRQNMRLVVGDGETHSWYGLGTWSHRFKGGSRLRIFDFGGRVRDNIPDDLRQWFQPIGGPGRMLDRVDFLPGLKAWKNALYIDLDQQLGAQVRLLHRVKWDIVEQQDPEDEVSLREGRKLSGFLGVINKAEWSIPVGLGVLEPRFKSEFRKERPFSTRLPASTSVEEIFFLMWTQPLFAESVGVSYYPRYGRQLFNTELQVGVEAGKLWLLDGMREEVDADFFNWTAVAQLLNRTAYQGYQLVTTTGLQFQQRRFEGRPAQESSLVFMTLYAGLSQ